MPEKFMGKYRIGSRRLKGWDYAKGGYYYVTICVKNHICVFGDVIDGKMQLNEYGKIADKFWNEIPNHFEQTWLDAYVIMPDHIHGIIVMKGKKSDDNIDQSIGNECGEEIGNEIGNGDTPNLGVSSSPSISCPPNSFPSNDDKCVDINKSKNDNFVPKKSIPNWKPASLGVIINQFKRICTIKYNKLEYDWPGWQARFDDKIIRDDKHLFNVRQYIKNNPKNWNK